MQDHGGAGADKPAAKGEQRSSERNKESKHSERKKDEPQSSDVETGNHIETRRRHSGSLSQQGAVHVEEERKPGDGADKRERHGRDGGPARISENPADAHAQPDEA